MMNHIMGMNMKQMNSIQLGMHAMLTADSALNKAQIQNSAVNKMNGRANVLESEIKSGNGNIEMKEEELAEVKQSALNVAAAQADTLGEAQNAMKAASDTDVYEASDAALLAKAKGEGSEEAIVSEKEGEGNDEVFAQNAGSIISVIA